MEILAALEIKKMLVDRLVNLLSRGYVLPVVKYMAQCWRNTDTDISLIRLVSPRLFFVVDKLFPPIFKKPFYSQNVLHYLGVLKGVFAKNERGYRLNAIKKRF